MTASLECPSVLVTPRRQHSLHRGAPLTLSRCSYTPVFSPKDAYRRPLRFHEIIFNRCDASTTAHARSLQPSNGHHLACKALSRIGSSPQTRLHVACHSPGPARHPPLSHRAWSPRRHQNSPTCDLFDLSACFMELAWALTTCFRRALGAWVSVLGCIS
jgi:hypothetical protein